MTIVSGSCEVVPASSPPFEAEWQASLRKAIRDPAELCRRLGLPPALGMDGAGGANQFPLLVPEEFLRRMRPGDADDPLLRQVLPIAEETYQVPGFALDPLEEQAVQPMPGLLTKYAGRALLIATGACAVHCRYCFRRHFPYSAGPKSPAQWLPYLEHLRAEPRLEEVILSGGDPLILTDERLAWLLHELASIPHVRRIRIHTRLPIVIPSRVTPALLQLLSAPGPTQVMVVHANHAAELDESVARACWSLRKAGVMLLNQAVLLKGVNDSVAALSALSLRLVDLGIVPYYLHQLDRVTGTHPWWVSAERGRELVAALRSELSGYAVPRYVCEVPGELSKRPMPL